MARGGSTQLAAIAPDGSNRVVLTSASDEVFSFTFSPDRQSIALVVVREGARFIVLIASDGTHPLAIAGPLPSIDDLAWSPDGAQVAFVVAPDGASNGANEDVYVADAQGMGVHQLTNDPLPEVDPV